MKHSITSAMLCIALLVTASQSPAADEAKKEDLRTVTFDITGMD